MNILKVSQLSVAFPLNGGEVTAVDQVSLMARKGMILGVLGESGSGKSQLFRGITKLTSGRVSGSAHIDGVDLIALDAAGLSRVRGRKIGYIFQDPMTSLNPFLKVATQMAEIRIRHQSETRAEAEARGLELLNLVRIPDAARVMKSYPHELSGGMRQRVVIAMALMAEPQLLVADEPTTALDATVQLDILRLLRSLCDKTGVTIILISHDIGVISSVCDEVTVMYAGRIAEHGDTAQIISAPRHPYTRKLIDCTPDIERPRDDRIEGIAGTLPDPATPRQCCLFADRCEHVQPRCRETTPQLQPLQGGQVACHFPLGGC